MLHTLSQSELDQLTLWYLLQYSLSSYRKLMAHFVDASTAIQPENIMLWQNLNIHANHVTRLQQFYSQQGQADFNQCLALTLQCCDHILFQQHASYPDTLQPYSDSPPLLFVKGNAEILSAPQIAMVGSRHPSPHGAQIAYDFAHFFAENGYVVTSGLAVGIDAAAHLGATKIGQTLAIIGTGLDQCYPKTQQTLWNNILQTQGAIVSEFFSQTPPLKRNFPRRNRIISALSTATLVVEAGLDSGSLITARLAAEQGKHVFAIPGHIYSPQHKGCHQLIREGAILVDHPQQLLEEITLLTTAQPILASSKPRIPARTTTHIDQEPMDLTAHLQAVRQQLDWSGISIDELALRTQMHISELNIALVELELLGFCTQQAGRYFRT